jgi:sterol desaturase/sphingolipid hydroxylase (fatty acid hydroxylase superfamily)
MSAFVSSVLAQPAALRVAALVALLALLMWLEYRKPRRQQSESLHRRWRNIALGVLSSLLMHALLPITAVAMAVWVSQQNMGILNWISLPLWFEFMVVLIAFDFAIYWQHRWAHQFSWLWRLHRVHHSDTAFDTTLGLRFHPGEIILSMIYKLMLVIALGASPLAVAAYELVLAAFSLMTHANIQLSSRTDAIVRRLFVTPDWHRVHHSTDMAETNSNYGNMLSCWDHWFGSAIAQPKVDHSVMPIGLQQFRDHREQTFASLLIMPFKLDSKRTTQE